MNPETIVFLKLTESTVGALPAERKSEFQFGIGESDMVGYVLGFASALFCVWLYRKLQRKPVSWWKAPSGRVRIADLSEMPRLQYSVSDVRDDASGDCLLPVDALRVI